MKFVAFGHERGVGKDTSATFLLTHLRTNGIRSPILKIGFADEVKRVSYSLYKWSGLQDKEFYDTHYELKDVVLPKIGKSPRQIWIELGGTEENNDGLRKIHKETWVRLIHEKAHDMKAEFIVLSDLRFNTEFEFLKSNSGVCVKLTNPRVAQFDDPADSCLRSKKNWDYVINNDGDFKSLFEKVVTFSQEKLGV